MNENVFVNTASLGLGDMIACLPAINEYKLKNNKNLFILTKYADIFCAKKYIDMHYVNQSDIFINKDFTLDKFIIKLTNGIKVEIDNNETLPPKKRLNENEIKVGYALIDILGNWEQTLDVMNGGSKFNKNSVLETMRNYTNLSTKDIRSSMKRYKDIYSILKLDGLENGFE